MQAIVTRYHGPTNTRGSRISATAANGERIYLPYDDSLNSDDMHRKAAYALRDKMGWSGEMVGGGLQKGMCWVFLEK